VLESLEQREVPAIAIQFDYSRDTAGFFADPNRRAVLQRAADDLASHLSANLYAITPGGANSYTMSFFDPATGQYVSVANRALPANTIVVYAGGRDLTGYEAGIGGYGGYGASGTQDWLNTLQGRGPGGMMLWGGSLAFDTTTNWFVSTGTSGLGGSQVDFYTVASHELGHLLGLGTAPAWFGQSSGGYFRGPNAQAVYGGPVPLSGDGAHWADGITVGGTQTSMDPMVQLGTRTPFTSLDYGAMKDIGWAVTATPTAPPPAPPPVTLVPIGSGSPTAIFTPPTSNGTGHATIMTGPADGSAQAFGLNSAGQLVAAGPRVVPFPGYTGVIRAIVADFNGDGRDDFAFGTGPGTGAQVRVIDGRTGTDLAAPTTVLDGFAGGVYLAAADVDRDGKAELAVSADAGGGNRVSLFKVNLGLQRLTDFMAFGDPNFRGGSRIAMGDINHDGAADLIVGAGVGGGPRVAVYSGVGLGSGRAVKLTPDFFALDPNLRSGVFVTTADLNGDGYSDVIYSLGNSGGPRVRVLGGSVLSANPGRDAYFLPAMADFFALDANDRNGLRVAAHDLNADGKAEIIVAGGGTASPVVRLFTFPNLSTAVQSIDPFGDPFLVDGVYVG
jgi:hypothetical protein